MFKHLAPAVLLSLFSLGASAEAASYHHIDELAVSLQRQSSELAREFQRHYGHTSYYTHLRHDANKMHRLAEHIHEVAHHHGSVAHLRSDLRDLDRLFHHVEELIEAIEGEAFFHQGHGHFGHVHGSTGHVLRYMKRFETTLHHLADDINEMYRHHHHDHGFHDGHDHVIQQQFQQRWRGGFRDRHESHHGSHRKPAVRLQFPGFGIRFGG